MKTSSHNEKRGFTLIELLVIILIIGVLASLLLISLSVAQEYARSAFCKNNLKQLSLTYLLYSDDNSDKLVLNGYSGCGGDADSPLWVRGYQNNFSCSEDYTNKNLLINSKFALFANYLKTEKVYKCPSDRKIFYSKTTTTNKESITNSSEKIRSYSLNWNLGWNKIDEETTYLSPVKSEIKEKINQIQSPAECLSFLDVYSESICWVWFGIKKDEIVMYPAAYHNKSGNLIFVDNHVEKRKWRDERTTDYNSIPFHYHNYGSTGNKDLEWLVEKGK